MMNQGAAPASMHRCHRAARVLHAAAQADLLGTLFLAGLVGAD